MTLEKEIKEGLQKGNDPKVLFDSLSERFSRKKVYKSLKYELEHHYKDDPILSAIDLDVFLGKEEERTLHNENIHVLLYDPKRPYSILYSPLFIFSLLVLVSTYFSLSFKLFTPWVILSILLIFTASNSIVIFLIMSLIQEKKYTIAESIRLGFYLSFCSLFSPLLYYAMVYLLILRFQPIRVWFWTILLFLVIGTLFRVPAAYFIEPFKDKVLEELERDSWFQEKKVIQKPGCIERWKSIYDKSYVADGTFHVSYCADRTLKRLDSCNGTDCTLVIPKCINDSYSEKYYFCEIGCSDGRCIIK